jgi:hypothetical protein
MTAKAEHEADVDLRPFLRREINGHERPEPGLHVGDEKDEPVESAEAFRGRCLRCFRSTRLTKRGRNGLAIAPAAVVWIVAKAA